MPYVETKTDFFSYKKNLYILTQIYYRYTIFFTIIYVYMYMMDISLINKHVYYLSQNLTQCSTKQ